MRFSCSICGAKKYWKLRDGQYRCRSCRHDRSGWLTPCCRLTTAEWNTLIDQFLIGANSVTLTEKLGRSLGIVTKALQMLRTCMALDPPPLFSGTVEVDETYLGGQWKNKRKGIKSREPLSRRGRGTTKQPVFGILARDGYIWAELVDDVEAKDLVPLITKQVKKGARVCSDTWRAYTGLAAKGYVHRTVEHSEGEYVSKTNRRNHINGLEGFWGYLKRKLASKGGVRRRYLPFFLGEYVWRYNHRTATLKQQRQRLLELIRSRFGARS